MLNLTVLQQLHHILQNIWRIEIMESHDNKLIWEALKESEYHQASTSGGEAGERNAVREVAEAIRNRRFSLKEVDLSAGTLVVSTGGEKSIILKAVGYEDDHDIPVSQRPDKSTRLRHDVKDDDAFRYYHHRDSEGRSFDNPSDQI